MMKRTINYKKIAVIYICIYMAIISIYCGVSGTIMSGEWDDYCIPAVSLIREGNFTVDTKDIIQAAKLMPEWADSIINNTAFSPYTAMNGEQLAWYAPTYSIACIPLILLLQLLELPVSRAFVYTNLFSLLLLLIFVLAALKVSDKCKLALIVLLSANPIVFYLDWPSAEAFIFCVLGAAMVAWHNKWYKRAAVFVSVAGTLNPTIMCIGIVMIIEYLYNIWESRERGISVFKLITKNIKDITLYAMCYIVGILPMIYNYMNVGHINLTASVTSFTGGRESVFSRFIAYLFDLNFGILPYYTVVFIIGFLMLIGAIIKKHWKFIEWYFVFLLNVYLYSIMVHINSGMSGIARYNSWSVVILLFAVCINISVIFEQKIVKRIIEILLIIGNIVTSLIVFNYGPAHSIKAHYLNWTPIAAYFLDNMPQVYNPLHSTFNSRNNHIDGGYGYETPIVYASDDLYVRKILASEKDKEYLYNSFVSCSGEDEWFKKKIDNLDEKEQYISIPKDKMIVKASQYNPGDKIVFTREGFNAADYVVKGLSHAEDWGTWTEGNTLIIRYLSTSAADKEKCTIKCHPYGLMQRVRVRVNDDIILETYANGQDLVFEFNNPGEDRVVNIRIEMPDAISPLEIGEGIDSRVLGLGLEEMVIE